jgi:hypothetical protein
MLTFDPILDGDLPAVGEFLHRHHDATRSPEGWAKLFRYPWEAVKPNNGFQLRDDGRLMGIVGGIYSRQAGRGFCNISSWAVTESHRGQSTRLLHTCLAQPGWCFTNYSAMPVVESVLKFLKFTVLDESYYVAPNRPSLGGATVAGASEENLKGAHLEVYRDHRMLPRLIHLSVDSTYVALTPDKVKGMPAAEVMHAGDPEVFTRALPAIGSHLLLRGMQFLKVERRFVTAAPSLGSLRPMSPPKYFRGDGVPASQVSTLYSERVLL